MTQRLEAYLRELRDIRASGAGVNEISYYHPLANLLNELGKPLKSKVRCILNLRSRGAGVPDGGLFTADQLRRTAADEWHEGQIPNRGVLEVKGTGVELVALAEVLEEFRLADSEAAFWRAASHPRTLAETHGPAFAEFLTRALLQAAPLTSPQDVAWFLASYARDARHRVEAADLPALTSLREALEEALGIKFSGDKGEHFFRSTFVQTLFYGVFSAWVLWHREQPGRADAFDWRTAVYHLRVPMLQALFHQVSAPANLRPLGLEPILVILGNPPYNGYAGMAVEEERELSMAYRAVHRVAPPQGQGLNDLFVRFFRMAERRIVEKSGRGVVCFISNYSWLDGLSFAGMRERYLEAFDRVDIDCLNGDKYKTGKLTPEGKPDPSVFSTEQNRDGIQVGTAIATLVKTGAARGESGAAVRFRHFWGASKPSDLLAAGDSSYAEIVPAVELGFTLLPTSQQPEYFTWPQLPELFPASFPGVKTSRDDFLVAIDRSCLEERIRAYFEPAVSDEEMRSIAPGVMDRTSRFDPIATRKALQRRGARPEGIVRYAYRPFDVRWLYWEPETKLLDEKRSEYVPHAFAGNRWLSAGQRNRKDDFYQPQVTERLADHHIVESNVGMFPMMLSDPLLGERSPNWSSGAEKYLTELGATISDLFHHFLAVAHSHEYVSKNAGALRQDWPRNPLPAKRAELLASADLGRRVAALVLLEQELNENYRRVTAATYSWSRA